MREEWATEQGIDVLDGWFFQVCHGVIILLFLFLMFYLCLHTLVLLGVRPDYLFASSLPLIFCLSRKDSRIF